MQFVSVILCTHNPKPEYLWRVLASLRGQTLPAEQWEFLLIDNASEEPLVERWDISWYPHGKHIREDELGLTAARLRGIQESSGKLLVLVDDDNLLAPDYLEQATAISARFSVLGVFGAGILEPEFEIHPPPALRSHLDLLALRNVASALWTNNARDAQSRPWGAGLCVTRRVADLYRQFVADLGISAVLDRRGQRLFSGGDDVFSRVAAEIGLHFGVFPNLRITRLIHAGRLNKHHLLRLIQDHAFSHGVLAYMLDGIQPGRIDFVRRLHLLLHAVKNSRWSMRCQWAESRGADDAAQFISENRLKPVGSGEGAHAGSDESYLFHYLPKQRSC